MSLIEILISTLLLSLIVTISIRVYINAQIANADEERKLQLIQEKTILFLWFEGLMNKSLFTGCYSSPNHLNQVIKLHTTHKEMLPKNIRDRLYDGSTVVEFIQFSKNYCWIHEQSLESLTIKTKCKHLDASLPLFVSNCLSFSKLNQYKLYEDSFGNLEVALNPEQLQKYQSVNFVANIENYYVFIGKSSTSSHGKALYVSRGGQWPQELSNKINYMSVKLEKNRINLHFKLYLDNGFTDHFSLTKLI